MILKIKNEYLTAEINENGAELSSLKSNKSGTEYRWQGDAKYWTGRSPVLFPICGRLFEGKYTYGGKTYEMANHGIVRHADFSSEKLSDVSVELTYLANEESKKIYPFDFEFKVKFALNGNAIEVTYSVKNTGVKDLPFSFGAHPAFNVPFNKDEKFEDYYLEFKSDELEKILLSERGLYLCKTEKYPLKDGKLGLKHELFDNDASFFKTNCGSVKLKSVKNDSSLEVSYEDMTCVGVWHKPKTDAPYVCIEPWHGIPADEGKTDDFSSKRDMITLKPEEEYENTYVIKINE